ncbi:unnamed protein product [Owenia fusiformis]|uniref:Peptidase S1 domain-containing protein n=1 Tax=Owenia fusiformis TaxID=6347 RepID=A0A8S4NYU8_OWEFU|nr:unnamed protein product [Owenia fusiformis]
MKAIDFSHVGVGSKSHAFSLVLFSYDFSNYITSITTTEAEEKEQHQQKTTTTSRPTTTTPRSSTQSTISTTLPPFLSSCGQPFFTPSPRRAEPRIIGGEAAVNHTWPWAVSLLWNGEHYCGGTLISRSYVVTAAHCFVNQRAIFYRNWTLVFGEHDLSITEKSQQERKMNSFTIHPFYEAEGVLHDIALVELNRPIDYNIYVSPVCLPHVDYFEKAVTEGDPGNINSCYIVGWGVTQVIGPDQKQSNKLQELAVPIINQTLCNSPYWYDGRVKSTMMCAGYAEGRKDACSADSGSPLVCYVGNRWVFGGIISWGIGCAAPRHPGVYTRVPKYYDWIVGNTDVAGENYVIETPVPTTPSTTKRTTTIPFEVTTLDPGPMVSRPCGDRNLDQLYRTRIIGGKQVIPLSWPWMVSLWYDGQHYCAGTLINNYWILTAAQCFSYNRNVPRKWTANLARHDLSGNDRLQRQINFAEIISHENFTNFPISNDIALVRLATPIAYSTGIFPACIPYIDPFAPALRYGDPDNRFQCFSMGWGIYSARQFSTYSNVIRQVQLPILKSSLCNSTNWYNGKVSNEMLCAGYANGGKDTCTGDSGGPLICNLHNRWQQAGITSWGGVCAQARQPGVYTRVASYTSWINETMYRIDALMNTP